MSKVKYGQKLLDMMIGNCKSWSLDSFASLMRSIGVMRDSNSEFKEWLEENGYITKIGVGYYLSIPEYKNWFVVDRELVFDKLYITRLGFIVLTNKLYKIHKIAVKPLEQEDKDTKLAKKADKFNQEFFSNIGVADAPDLSNDPIANGKSKHE